jgi:putative transcriptional regulator
MAAARTSRIGENLAPGFIAAMPQLSDPNFHRTVVLLLRHGEEGGFGLVINRPAAITVDELCHSQGIPYHGPMEQPVMIGGPVEVDRHMLVLHGEPPIGAPGDEDEMFVAQEIRLVTARAGFIRLTSRGATRFRCYVGYAGWAPGQLDNELAEGAWVPLPASPRLMFDEPAEIVWDSALRQAGIDPATLVPGGQLN